MRALLDKIMGEQQPCLPRTQFKELTDERTALARSAAEKLGYHKLAHAVCTGHLLSKLRELDIEPLARVGVEAYKASKAKTGLWMRTKLAWMWGAGIAPALSVLSEVLYKHTDPNAVTAINILCILSLASTAVSIIVTIGLVCNIGEGSDKRTVHEWQRVPLKGYQGSVPEFVLHKAVQIATAVPTAYLSIEHLCEVQDKGRPRPTPDPFLVVSYGEVRDHFNRTTEPAETYYIDVWNEREYERAI